MRNTYDVSSNVKIIMQCILPYHAYGTKLILSVIINLVQPTYHHINIHMSTNMIIHVANPKLNVDIVISRMKMVGGGKT